MMHLLNEELVRVPDENCVWGSLVGLLREGELKVALDLLRVLVS